MDDPTPDPHDTLEPAAIDDSDAEIIAAFDRLTRGLCDAADGLGEAGRQLRGAADAGRALHKAADAAGDVARLLRAEAGTHAERMAEIHAAAAADAAAFSDAADSVLAATLTPAEHTPGATDWDSGHRDAADALRAAGLSHPADAAQRQDTPGS